MRLIGYWITSLRDTSYFPPQEFVADWPDELRAKIANYLDSGAEYNVFRGLSWCRFYCGCSKMGHRELSDGYYVWPKGLSHYVREHSVSLPEEFVRHVISGGVPAVQQSSGESLDDTFWKEWCRATSSRGYDRRLRVAIDKADIRAQATIDRAVVKMETETGLSGKTCRWSGCNNLALFGKAFCARCMIKGSEDFHVLSEYDPRPFPLASP